MSQKQPHTIVGEIVERFVTQTVGPRVFFATQTIALIREREMKCRGFRGELRQTCDKK